jgi:magnesium transporter
LILGLFGGMAAASIMGGFEEALNLYPELFYFTPLIAAMAGNVGVQSSAIIVQGLASDNLKGSQFNRLIKEIGLSMVNGVILAGLIFLFGSFLGYQVNMLITISISLVIVIIMASLIGTFVPLILDKRGIDPAVATGPFITTSNDIFGIFIFFFIAKLILGF